MVLHQLHVVQIHTHAQVVPVQIAKVHLQTVYQVVLLHAITILLIHVAALNLLHQEVSQLPTAATAHLITIIHRRVVLLQVTLQVAAHVLLVAVSQVAALQEVVEEVVHHVAVVVAAVADNKVFT